MGCFSKGRSVSNILFIFLKLKQGFRKPMLLSKLTAHVLPRISPFSSVLSSRPI